MAGGIIHSVIAAHTPRMGIEDSAPDFVWGLIAGAYEMGERIRADKPDVIVVNSAHWVTTFNWYATRHAKHKGTVIAEEAPDIIPGEPYAWKGDPEFADALIAEMEAGEIPVTGTDAEHLDWDYGSWVPLKYMDPAAEIPVVLTGTVLMSDLDECMAAGAALRRAAEKTGRRVTAVASTALSHKLVRGPDQWPSPERRELDAKFIDMLKDGRIDDAKAWLPEYASWVAGEMGGRNVAFMLGTMDETGRQKFTAQQFGPYCQSSGSGNVNICAFPAGK